MKTLVAIPVYNEARHLDGVLNAVRGFADDILVIDDGSVDKTPALLRERGDVPTITHLENRGYGQSLIDAFAYAGARGYDWVITMDCDEQHEPAQIPEFLRCLACDRADVISGSRYLRPHRDDDHAPPDRRRINQIITQIMNQLFGLRLTDSFCGFKAHRVAAMQRLQLDEPGYAFPLQFWVQCARAGLCVRELPVRRIYRDKSRRFGGTLDDPAARLEHYLAVLTRELRRPAPVVRREPSWAVCRCSLTD